MSPHKMNGKMEEGDKQHSLDGYQIITQLKNCGSISINKVKVVTNFSQKWTTIQINSTT